MSRGDIPQHIRREIGLEPGDRSPEEARYGVSENPLLATRVDMGKAISEGIDPPSELEADILLEGKIHHLFGPSEHGKTIITLWLVKRRVEARKHVVVFDSSEVGTADPRGRGKL